MDIAVYKIHYSRYTVIIVGCITRLMLFFHAESAVCPCAEYVGRAEILNVVRCIHQHIAAVLHLVLKVVSLSGSMIALAAAKNFCYTVGLVCVGAEIHECAC